MLILHGLIAVLFVACPGNSAVGQDVQLRLEFRGSKPIFRETTIQTSQWMRVMGAIHNHAQRIALVESWTPKKKDNGEGWIVVQRLEAVKGSIDVDGKKIIYDSTKGPPPNNPFVEASMALLNVELTFTVSPWMEATRLEGRKELLKKLIKAKPTLQPILQDLLGDDEAAKRQWGLTTDVLPEGKVAKGDGWERKTTSNMGAFGTYETARNYTYEGRNGKLDMAKVETMMKHRPPAANAQAGLPFRIEDFNLVTRPTTGLILFDRELGRPARSEECVELEGKMTVSIGGLKTEVELRQKQITTRNYGDNNPSKK
jgi:hypothetical protein